MVRGKKNNSLSLLSLSLFSLFPIFSIISAGRPGPEADAGDPQVPSLDDRVVLAERAERPDALLVRRFFSVCFFGRVFSSSFLRLTLPQKKKLLKKTSRQDHQQPALHRAVHVPQGHARDARGRRRADGEHDVRQGRGDRHRRRGREAER